MSAEENYTYTAAIPDLLAPVRAERDDAIKRAEKAEGESTARQDLIRRMSKAYLLLEYALMDVNGMSSMPPARLRITRAFKEANEALDATTPEPTEEQVRP